MLQEQLDPGESFGLPTADLTRRLRRTMRADRRRGDEVVDALARHFDPGARYYHKAGFAGDWYSDNVYIYDTTRSERWIVVMAGYPGRRALSQAADILGDIMASGEL